MVVRLMEFVLPSNFPISISGKMVRDQASLFSVETKTM